MPDSITEQLQQDMECEGLLGCSYELEHLDNELFQTLVISNDRFTVDEVAN